jgi:hypothetical protein
LKAFHDVTVSSVETKCASNTGLDTFNLHRLTVVLVHDSPAPDLVVHAPEPDSQPLVQVAAAASLQQNPLPE